MKLWDGKGRAVRTTERGPVGKKSRPRKRKKLGRMTVP